MTAALKGPDSDPSSGGGDPSRRAHRHSLRLGRHRIGLPKSRLLRVLLGGGLMLGGTLGFLPVLGFWMLPLGAAVLSIDLPPMRRLRRRTEVWWGRSGARNRADSFWGGLRRQWKNVRPKRWD